jgi:[protein-PII] uridylyltransferase
LRRGQRIAVNIEKTLRGEVRLAEFAPPKQPRDVRRGAFAIEPEVTVDNNLSSRYTVVEVSGLDRPGLLRDLTASLSSLNLNIGSAHIVTFGEKAVDSFYISDLTGQKINAPARQAAIKRRLLADFAAD